MGAERRARANTPGLRAPDRARFVVTVWQAWQGMSGSRMHTHEQRGGGRWYNMTRLGNEAGRGKRRKRLPTCCPQVLVPGTRRRPRPEVCGGVHGLISAMVLPAPTTAHVYQSRAGCLASGDGCPICCEQLRRARTDAVQLATTDDPANLRQFASCSHCSFR